MTYTEVREQLSNHPDFQAFLGTVLKNTENFDNSDLHPEGSINGGTYELNHEDNEYHVRLGSYNRIFWNDEMIKKLERRFEVLNDLSKELSFTFEGNVSDWDEEVGERTWAARIYFKVKGL
jgi:hypothetical protein